MEESDLFYTLALLKVEGIRDIIAKRLLNHFGNAEKIFTVPKKELLAVEGIGEIICRNLRNKKNFDAAKSELKFIRDHKIQTVFYKNKGYPKQLTYCCDGPVILFLKGNIQLEQSKIISIVGTRQITNHGIDFCRKLIADLAPLHPIIVSGFAFGTDITAQLAAVENNLQTIAVFAHGLNQVYPRQHLKYQDKILEHGGFITEFWSTSKPERENFVRRNRIVAGISEATIVIESAEKGGSLITAYMANDYNREVFAVPGRTTDPFSSGCNRLIKTQRAHLLTSAADLVYMMNWEIKEPPKKSIQKQLFVSLQPEEQQVYDFLEQNGRELLDLIALNCKLPVHTVASILISLELKGIVRPLPGKLFEII